MACNGRCVGAMMMMMMMMMTVLVSDGSVGRYRADDLNVGVKRMAKTVVVQ
jgi:hypothetical protein